MKPSPRARKPSALRVVANDETPPPPPTHLSETDRLRLAEAQLRVVNLDRAIHDHAKAHNEAVAKRDEWLAKLSAIGADLRERYQFDAQTPVSVDTGAIGRKG